MKFVDEHVIKFQPWSEPGEHWSTATVSVLKQFGDDAATYMVCEGTVLDVTGEYGDSEHVGKLFSFEMGEIMNEEYKGSYGSNRMLKAFKQSVLPNAEFRVELVS